MKTPTICPFCGGYLPLEQELCVCGAYRVTDENYTQSFKQRFGVKNTDKNINELMRC